MKKRVLAGIMMAAMMVASVMSVSAAGSKQEEVEVGAESKGSYIVESEKDTFDYLVDDITSKLPSGATEEKKEELKASAKEAQKAMDNYKPSFFDKLTKKDDDEEAKLKELPLLWRHPFW